MNDDDVDYGGEPWRPAVESGNLAQLQDLVEERGLAVLTQNFMNEDELTHTTPLIEAVRRQHVDMVRYLLEECSSVIDVNASGNEHDEKRGYTSLHFATRQNNVELVRYLVEKGGDVNAATIDRQDKTPLHMAVDEKHVDIVKFLIDTGLCNIDLETGDDCEPANATALLLAVSKYVDGDENGEYFAIVQYVLERSPGTEEEKADRATKVLPVPCHHGSLELATYLVESCRADVNAHGVDDGYDGLTPLMVACKHGCLEIVQYLVEKCNANLDLYGTDQKTNPLLQACESGHLEITQYLIEKCAANVKTRQGGNSKRGTLLHVACQSGKLSVVRYLVEKCGLNVGTTDKEGNTALHIAASWRKLDVVQYLVEKCGSNVEARNDDQWTALHMACNRRGADAIAVVKHLVDVCHANVNVPNNQGETALHIASQRRSIEMVRCLIQSESVNVNAADKNGHTAMHRLVGGGYIHSDDAEICLQIAKILVTVDRTSLEARDNDGRTMLHLACEMAVLQLVTYLVQGCRIDINAVTNVGETALLIACRERHVEIVQCLTSLLHADVNAADKKGRTALHFACSSVVDEERARNSRIGHWGGHTAGYDSNCCQIVRCLLKTGCVDVNAQDEQGKTALHHSFVNPFEVAQYDEIRQKYLHDACFNIVQLLVKSGQFNVDAKDNTGQTALHYYCSFPNIEIPRYLIEHGKANVDAIDNEGRTVLHRAASIPLGAGMLNGLRLVLFLVSRISTDLLEHDGKYGHVPALDGRDCAGLCEHEEIHPKRQKRM